MIFYEIYVGFRQLRGMRDLCSEHIHEHVTAKSIRTSLEIGMIVYLKTNASRSALSTLAHPDRFFSTCDFRKCRLKDQERANLASVLTLYIYLKIETT